MSFGTALGIYWDLIWGCSCPSAIGGGSCWREDAFGCSARGQLLCREARLYSAVTEHMEILAAKYQSLCRSSANRNFCQCITWLDFEGFHNKRHVLT